MEVEGVDEGELARFRTAMRRRYADGEILAELRGCAERLGRSPTMREFQADVGTRMHPHTVVERFGSWNEAKRAAGLRPRRFATRTELLAELRSLGDELGRPPTSRDLEHRRGAMASKSLYWHTFGSLANALREAGFDLPGSHERLEHALERGVRLGATLGRLPTFADWARARDDDPSLPTEWQVYRLVGGGRGAWARFQYLVRERLVEAGGEVGEGGRLLRVPRTTARRRRGRSPRDATDRSAAPPARGPRGAAPP